MVLKGAAVPPEKSRPDQSRAGGIPSGTFLVAKSKGSLDFKHDFRSSRRAPVRRSRRLCTFQDGKRALVTRIDSDFLLRHRVDVLYRSRNSNCGGEVAIVVVFFYPLPSTEVRISPSSVKLAM